VSHLLAIGTLALVTGGFMFRPGCFVIPRFVPTVAFHVGMKLEHTGVTTLQRKNQSAHTVSCSLAI